MPQTYEIQGPDGQTYEIQSDHLPTRQEVSAALTKMGASEDEAPHSTRGPHGYPTNELGQEVTDAKGTVYQPGFFQRVLDTVSGTLTHPTPGMQLAGDTAAVLSGALGSRGVPARLPETPAAVAEAASSARASAAGPADAVISALMKKTGLDPDAVSLQATRMRAQAAKIATKNARTARQLGETAPAPPVAPAAPTAPILTPEQLAAQAASGHAPAPADINVEGPFGGTTTPPETAKPVSGPQGIPTRSAGGLTEAQMGRGQMRPPAAASGGSAATAPSLATAKTETIHGLLDRWASRAEMELTPQERDAGVVLVREGAKPSEVVDAILQHRGGSSPYISVEDAAAKLMDKWGLSTNPETGGPQHARGTTGKWKAKPQP